MFDITPYPTFSWSLSRHKTLTSCARKYGYEYYFSHNGWLSYNVEPFHQHVYRLKKATIHADFIWANCPPIYRAGD